MSSSTTLSEIHKAARAIATTGWPVFPCSPDTKQPLIKSGFKGATTDPEKTNIWWGRWPDAMIGVPTGATIGAFVIDIDPKDGSDPADLLASLKDVCGVDIEFDGPCTLTPRGGLHNWFAWPEHRTIRNRVGIIPGVDIRGQSGYVIVPPSVRVGAKAKADGCQGVAYTWRGNVPAHQMAMPKAPEALIDFITHNGRFTPTSTVELAVATLDDRQRKYARTALDAETRSVATCPAGKRNSTLNKAAYNLGQLVGAGALSEVIVVDTLEESARECGLTNDDGILSVRKTIRSGLSSGKAAPRDISQVGARIQTQAEADSSAARPTSPSDFDSLIFDPKDPLPTAQTLTEAKFSDDGIRTLHRYRETFYQWEDGAFRPVSRETIKSIVWPFLFKASRLKDGQQRPFQPNRYSVGEVIAALQSVCFLPDQIEAPAWICDDGDLPSAFELFPCKNGLLHLPTGDLWPATPSFFNLSVSPVEFDETAPEPKVWLAFLDSLWPDDQESIDALQEWFGYLLSADSSQQKILLIVGPKRSGKGTIARVLTALLGPDNVVNPTLSSLALNFGLTPLICSPAAIITDARLGPGTDQAVVVERLLSISGEDNQTIDRKYSSAWTGRLPTRFTILTNELPRLADSSGAMASRFIVLNLERSFFGKEDHHLTDRLMTELPGTLRWAIDGYDRLRRRRRLTQPKSACAAIDEIEALGSPVSVFIHERCRTGTAFEIPCGELFGAWQNWCDETGRRRPGDVQTFGRNLRAALPQIKVVQRRIEGRHVRHYQGIDLHKPGAA